MVCTISEGERGGDDISSNVIQEVENTAVGANDDDDVYGCVFYEWMCPERETLCVYSMMIKTVDDDSLILKKIKITPH